VLAKDPGADGDFKWVTVSGSGTPTRPSIAAVDLFWDIPSGLPYANIGTAGALSLAVHSNAVVGEFDCGFYGKVAALKALSGGSQFLKTASTSVGESNSISVMLWMKPFYQNGYALIIGKNYYLNDAAGSPYYAWNVRYNATAGQWFAEVYTNATTRNVTAPYLTDYIPLNLWTHIGFTYDAATGDMILYKNGLAITVPINFGAHNIQYGTHGSYCVGADAQYTPRSVNGLFEDIRVCSTVLSATDVLGLYVAALASKQ
jgi:hypothetical protein